MLKIKKYRKNNKKGWPLVVVLLVLAGALLLFLLEITNTINLFHSKQPPAATGPETKGEPRADPGEDSDQNESDQPSGDDDVDTSQALLVPTGDFVSNHRPNLDGDPAPNTIQSTCVTTPGATCSIMFEKDGIVKTLPEQTADSEGAAYWDWTLQDYDFTEGPWNIEAKVTLGSQTKTAEDPLQLMVSP